MIEVVDEKDQPGDPGDAQAVLGRRSGRDAKVASRDIFDHERQRRAGRGETEIAPGDALPVGSQTTAVVGTVDLDPGLREAIAIEIDALREERSRPCLRLSRIVPTTCDLGGGPALKAINSK